MATRIQASFPIFLAFLFLSSFAQGPALESRESPRQPPLPSQFSTEPEIQVEIQIANEHDTHVVLTNLSEEPLTAFYLQISYLSENRRPSKMGWDAFLMNKSAIAKNANLSLPISHTPGVAFLGKVEVNAAVWASGTMYGPPEQLKYIFANRTYRAHALDRIISLLQTGLQQDWTRERYLLALDHEGKSVFAQVSEVRFTLKANPNLDANPDARQKIIQKCIDSFSAQREALRQSKPDFTAPYIPN